MAAKQKLITVIVWDNFFMLLVFILFYYIRLDSY